MNHTDTHARWRVLPVHLVAKLLGVLVHVEGMPFGSNRTRLANLPRREDVVGSQVGGQLAVCASVSQFRDCDRGALATLLTQVIAASASRSLGDVNTAATDAAKAFRVGMTAFDSFNPDP